jgi:rod shape-determining protein MreD
VIPSAGAFWRLGLLLLGAVVLQISGVAGIRLLGGNPDLVPLLVAAVGLYAGSVSGAVCGFLAGLLLDLSVGQDLGASSLVLTAVGYWVGRFREIRDPAHGLAPVAVAAAATVGYAAGMAVVSFMLSIDAEVSVLVFREMLAAAFLNSLLALPAFWLVRWVLRPALAVDPLARRGRARPAGRIGMRGLEV